MEGDLKVRPNCSMIDSFNPRPRMEGDRRSIRMLTRPRGFNPRPRMEGDVQKRKAAVTP